jgi:hypothetical protein
MQFNNDLWQMVLIPIAGWLILTNIQHGKKLAVIEKTLDGLVSRMDQFIKSEMDLLKEIIKKD